MDFEDTTARILKVKWLEFIIVVFAIVYVVAKVQFGFLTDLVDSIFGKLFMVFLIIYLLSEEQYRIAIAIGLVFINVLGTIRERDDIITLRNRVQKSALEKSPEQKKISGPTNKCSRENRHISQEEKVPMGVKF